MDDGDWRQVRSPEQNREPIQEPTPEPIPVRHSIQAQLILVQHWNLPDSSTIQVPQRIQARRRNQSSASKIPIRIATTRSPTPNRSEKTRNPRIPNAKIRIQRNRSGKIQIQIRIQKIPNEMTQSPTQSHAAPELVPALARDGVPALDQDAAQGSVQVEVRVPVQDAVQAQGPVVGPDVAQAQVRAEAQVVALAVVQVVALAVVQVVAPVAVQVVAPVVALAAGQAEVLGTAPAGMAAPGMDMDPPGTEDRAGTEDTADKEGKESYHLRGRMDKADWVGRVDLGDKGAVAPCGSPLAWRSSWF